MGSNSNPAAPLPDNDALLTALQEQQLSTRGLQNELQVAKSHYGELLQYFKHLVWLTGGALGIVIFVGGYIFHTNLQDTLKDIKANATQLAATEAKNRVSEAFEEKNIKVEISDAARDKIGKITDKMIEQQLTSKLQPIQQRIILIGRISECEARIHTGFRSGLTELKSIIHDTQDPSVREFAQSTWTTTSEGYDSYYKTSVMWQGIRTVPQQFMNYLNQTRFAHNGATDVVSDLSGVVRVINQDQELNNVAAATLVFREMSEDRNIKMFDFDSVNSWCANHEPKCKPAPPAQAPAATAPK